MTARKPSTPSTWVDPDEVPALTEEFFKQADQYVGKTLVKRGRPKSTAPKQAVKLRLDADVLEALRASGEGWQTRINDSLRAQLKLAGRV